jgi:hypothetical protein
MMRKVVSSLRQQQTESVLQQVCRYAQVAVSTKTPTFVESEPEHIPLRASLSQLQQTKVSCAQTQHRAP